MKIFIFLIYLCIFQFFKYIERDREKESEKEKPERFLYVYWSKTFLCCLCIKCYYFIF